MSTGRISAPRGLGIGWRPHIASFVEQRRDLGFVEVIAESLGSVVPPSLERLRQRGVAVIPHGVTLSLGGTDNPDRERVAHLARLAERLDAPLVSEHIAFVRAGGLEAGHLLPVPRTREMLAVLVENVRQVEACLPVPLALEHIAALVEWPENELDEAEFLTEVLDATSALLLLDLANLYAATRNHGADALDVLERLPLERLAYVHVAGGAEHDGLYHDTHAHPTPPEVLDLVTELCARTAPPGIMLERDDEYPSPAGLGEELDRIAAAAARGIAPRD